MVENAAGPRLPETGGIGTTAFTVLGTLLICMAIGGLLFNKRRPA